MNQFTNAMTKVPDTVTQNGALAFSTTQNPVLDLFGHLVKLDNDFDEVASELFACWGFDNESTLRLIAYARAITRKGNLSDLPIKGQGLKDFGRKAMLWLYQNHREVFFKNFAGFIEVGCWQDIWHKDFVGAWVNAKDVEFVKLITPYLKNDHLARKYLPRFKSVSNINKAKSETNREYKRARNRGLAMIVAEIQSQGYGKYTMKDLMRLKTEGTAHVWQQHISNSDFHAIDFDTLPGKALTAITKGEFLARHNLEDRFIKWLDTKDTLKSTSYLYELVAPFIGGAYQGGFKNPGKIITHTTLKQIQTYLDRAKDSKLNVMPCLDTSGSMTSQVGPTTAFNVCISLGIYFSMIQHGAFKDNVMMFDNTSKFMKLKGNYLDRLAQVMNAQTAWGGTNFLSIIDRVVKTRQANPQIPIEDYPNVYLVISDMQFNPAGANLTNHKAAIRKLNSVGLPTPLFVWWRVSQNGGKNYQNVQDDGGTIVTSGFDPSIVNMLMSEEFQIKFEEQGKSILEITPLEAMTEALSQEYLQLFSV